MRRPAFIARQASRPSGLVGRLLVRVMAGETAAFNREVVAALAPADGERILEVGFGHGRTLAELGDALPRARLAGLDVSADAARVAAARCRRHGQRIELRVGDSSALPWPDASFDRVLAVHTLYFWSDPVTHLAEVRRVLAPNGTFALGFRRRTEAAEASFPAPTYRFHEVEQVRSFLAEAGFGRIDIRDAASGADLRIALAHA